MAHVFVLRFNKANAKLRELVLKVLIDVGLWCDRSGSVGHRVTVLHHAGNPPRPDNPVEEAGAPPYRVDDAAPLMADIFAGPNVPITKAFLFCGWRAIPVDWQLDSSHDLSNKHRQVSLHNQL